MALVIETFGIWYDCSTNPEVIPRGLGFRRYDYIQCVNDYIDQNHIFTNDECVLHLLFIKWTNNWCNRYKGPARIRDID